MAEFDRKIEAVVDITRPAFAGIEEFTPKEVGRVGEAVAENFLSDSGYEFVERNWKTPFGEVDIIAECDDIVVFVEVKSRRVLGRPDDIAPEEAVDADKFERYGKMIDFYKMVHEEAELVRLDVVAVTFLSERVAHISHLEGGYWWDA